MNTLGLITLVIFILRFVVFTFRESPKFLLSKGYDAHAIDVLRSITKYNGAPEPRLSLKDFQALKFEETQRKDGASEATLNGGSQQSSRGSHAKQVAIGGFKQTFGHLKGLFANKKNAYLFVIMAIA